jgi:predicted AAA+ superfamily ATPase
VACALLKRCHFLRDTTGAEYRLHYFRDREKREVDFVVTKANRVEAAIEVKTSDMEPSPHLRYFADRARPALTAQLVLEAERTMEHKAGLKVAPLAPFLDQMPLGG